MFYVLLTQARACSSFSEAHWMWSWAIISWVVTQVNVSVVYPGEVDMGKYKWVKFWHLTNELKIQLVSITQLLNISYDSTL